MTEIDVLRQTFIGYCLGTPETMVPGHIQILGILQKHESGIPILEPGWQDSNLGPSGRVFWPPVNPFPNVSYNGRLVRLKVDKNLVHFGSSDPHKDWYQVAKKSRDAQWEVDMIGYPLLPGSPSSLPGEENLRHLRTGDLAYLIDKSAGFIYGPFAMLETGGHRRLVAPAPGSMRPAQFEVAAIPDQGQVETPSGSLYLLGAPSPDLGDPVDLAAPEDLASWLASRLRQQLPAALEVLDREQPGWRNLVAEALERLGDPVTRRLEGARWNRLEEILGAVAWDDMELRFALRESPRLRALLKEAEDDGLHAAIEAPAEDRPRERDRLQEEMQQELADLRRQVDEAREELEEAQARRTKLEDSASALQAAREHLEQAHERLVLDYSAFEALQRGSRPAPDLILHPLGSIDECADPDNFVERKLYPLMFKQAQAFSLELPRALHDALVCFRWTLVPHAGWSRSYQRALGNSCHLEILPVEASWLSFRQVWEDHVDPLWLGAIKNPDRIFLIHFQDLDRSLPEHWCRPFWNLDLGLSDRLHPTVPPGWPANLRFLASPAPDDRAIPLSPISLQHFAGVPPEPIGSFSSPAGQVPGDIPASTWLGWTRPDDAPEPDPDLASFKDHLLDRLTGGTLPRERGGQNRMTQIWKPTLEAADVIARGLAPEDRERAIQYLIKLRVEWPQSYVNFRGTDA